jgi:hypothetical protein
MRRRRSAFHAESDKEYMDKVKTSDVTEESPKASFLRNFSLGTPSFTAPRTKNTQEPQRRRRSAFHAESDREFLDKVKGSDLTEESPRANISENSAYRHLSQAQENICKGSPFTKIERNPLLHLHSDKFNANKMFEKESSNFEGFAFIESRKSSTSNPDSRKSSATDESSENCNEDGKSEGLISTSMRIIALADNQALNYSFINYLFGEEQEPCCFIKSPLDLRIRTHETCEKNVKYHLWIKNCNDGNASEKLKSIYMIYYKTVSSFAFLYSIDNKESFLCVKQTVKNLLNDLGRDKVKGILIGVKDEHSKPREVTRDEAENFRKEAGSLEHMEIDLGDISQREHILDILENLKKEKSKTS